MKRRRERSEWVCVYFGERDYRCIPRENDRFHCNKRVTEKILFVFQKPLTKSFN